MIFNDLALEKPVRGIDLEDLVYMLNKVKAALESLDSQQDLCLASTRGDTYGFLTREESEPARKRIRVRLQKKIDDLSKEIQRLVAVSSY